MTALLRTGTLAAGLVAAVATPVLADADDPHAQHHAPPPVPHERVRFEPPEPGSYELPPIDRVEQHALLGTSGSSEPLYGGACPA